MRTSWHTKRSLLPLLALLLGSQACFNQNDFDPDRLAGLKTKPSVAVPLLHGSVSIEDLLPAGESQYVAYDEDKLVHLLYSDTLYSTSIRNHFLLPTLSFQKTYLSEVKTLISGKEHVLVEERVYLDFGYNEARLDEILLKAGLLSISARSNVEADVKLQLTLPTVSKNGETVQLNLTLPANSTNFYSLEQSLQDFLINLEEFPLGDNRVPVDILATTYTQQDMLLDVNDYVDVSINLGGMEFKLIKGYFGQIEVSLPQDEMAIDIFEKLFSKAKFSLKNPMLRLDFLNSNGVPVQVQKEVLQARKSTGETLAIATDPASQFDLNYPAVPGQMATTSIDITNIGAIMDLAPDFIDYKLTGRLNAGQTQEIVNFLTDSSKTSVVFHADVPLWGSLEGFTLSDTLTMGIQAEESDYSQEEGGNKNYTISNANASIRTVIYNQFPLGSEVQIYFTDALYQVTDSLFTGGPFTMGASKVSATGDLLEESVSKQDIIISDKQLERILEADHIIIKSLLYTSRNADGSQPHVKIKADQRLEVNLGLKANLNLTVKR